MRCLVLAALLAMSPAAYAGDPPTRVTTRTFQVVDLVTPIPDFTLPAGKTPADKVKAQSTLDAGTRLVRTVTAIVKPDSWEGQGGTGKIEYFDAGHQMLVVEATPEVLKEVQDLLEALRKLQETNVVTEVRVISVPVGFREYFGEKCGDGAVLSESELTALMKAAQADRRVTVMQAPKVSTFDGQVATVRVGEEQSFVTGIDAMRLEGQTIFVPKNTPTHIGDALTLCGRVGGDGKSVTLRVNLTRTQVAGKVDLVPVVTQMTPVFEGGSQGKPVPFTQFVQAPDFKTYTAERTATVPSCGTVVVGGWKETRTTEFGPPVISTIPYLSRLFKNTGAVEEREVMVLATTRVVTPGDGDAKPVAPQCDAAAPHPVVVRAIRAAGEAKPYTPDDVTVRTQRLLYLGEPITPPASRDIHVQIVAPPGVSFIVPAPALPTRTFRAAGQAMPVAPGVPVAVVYPERYNTAARQEVIAPFAAQEANGTATDRTMWNWHFEPGTATLTPAGVVKLEYLAKATQAASGRVYLQTAADADKLPDSGRQIKPEARVAVLNMKRTDVIQKKLVAHSAGCDVVVSAAVNPLAAPVRDSTARTQPLVFTGEGVTTQLNVPQIQVQAMLMEVPADFMERTGLPADAPNQWILNAREQAVLNAAVRYSTERQVLSRPTIMAASGQTIATEVGGSRQAVVSLDVSATPTGELVVKPKTAAVWTGFKTKVTPALSADGQSIRLDVELQSHQEKPLKLTPVTLPVTPVFEGGSQGVPVPVTQFLEHAAVNVRSLKSSVVLPEGGTVVIGGMTASSGEKAKQLLLILTPHVVTPVTPAAATLPGPNYER